MKAPWKKRRACTRQPKRSRMPRNAHQPSTSVPARPKRSATPTSGVVWPSWKVMANQVVPQVKTHTARSCQLDRRCMERKRTGRGRERERDRGDAEGGRRKEGEGGV